MFVIERDESSAPPTILALREDEDGVNLVVLDADGFLIAHILTIRPDGSLRLFPYAEDVEGQPFQTTDAGYIKVVR